MKLLQTQVAGVFEASTDVVQDDRGRFSRLFCDDELNLAHRGRPVVQINQSITRKIGTLRGLHFQRPPCAEAKWIRCLTGRVFDVAVDLRRGSPTFLRWHAVELSAATMNALFVPEGCAHGFQVLEPDSELLYIHTSSYAPGHEGGIRYDEPTVSIVWPLPVTDISDRDRNHPLLREDFEGMQL